MTFRPVIVAFNKPKWYVVSKADKHNKTIYQLLPPSWRKDFFYVGRLDKDSRGLLLLTNVPELVNEYEHPKNKIFKIYEVQIDNFIKKHHLQKLKRGVWITDDGEYIPDTKINEHKWQHTDLLQFHDIHILKDRRWKFMARIVLTYGKKRHIRRALKAFGYKIYDLCRIKYGKYQLGNIKPGKYCIYKVNLKKEMKQRRAS